MTLYQFLSDIPLSHAKAVYDELAKKNYAVDPFYSELKKAVEFCKEKCKNSICYFSKELNKKQKEITKRNEYIPHCVCDLRLHFTSLQDLLNLIEKDKNDNT